MVSPSFTSGGFPVLQSTDGTFCHLPSSATPSMQHTYQQSGNAALIHLPSSATPSVQHTYQQSGNGNLHHLLSSATPIIRPVCLQSADGTLLQFYSPFDAFVSSFTPGAIYPIPLLPSPALQYGQTICHVDQTYSSSASAKNIFEDLNSPVAIGSEQGQVGAQDNGTNEKTQNSTVVLSDVKNTRDRKGTITSKRRGQSTQHRRRKRKRRWIDDEEENTSSSYAELLKMIRKNRASSGKRITAQERKEEQERDLMCKVRNGYEEGLKVVNIEGKGRGVVADKPFEKGEFAVEYTGELIPITTAGQREELYEKDEQIGCYMYYFNYKGQHYCIDATEETGRLGRLLNHSRKGNCRATVVSVEDRPRLVLVASHDIEKGDELTYDYGDRSPNAIKNHPWLKL